MHGNPHSPVRHGRVPGEPVHAGRRPPTAARALPGLGVVVALLLAALVAMAAPQPAGAQAAPRITGRYVVAESSAINSSSPKTVTARCDAGDQVLGGGGGAFAVAPTAGEMAAIGRKLEVTRLSPASPGRFTITAVETAGGTTGNWYVSVRAVCAANPVAGYQVVTTRSANSGTSPPEQGVLAECPGTKVALGSGATVTFERGRPVGGVGVSMALATSGQTYARAAEQPGGYAFTWSLTAFAVCATRPQGYEVIAEIGSGTGHSVSCSNGRRILNGGGFADTTLSSAIPFATVDDAAAAAPRNPAGGNVAAYAICADAVNR